MVRGCVEAGELSKIGALTISSNVVSMVISMLRKAIMDHNTRENKVLSTNT